MGAIAVNINDDFKKCIDCEARWQAIEGGSGLRGILVTVARGPMEKMRSLFIDLGTALFWALLLHLTLLFFSGGSNFIYIDF